MKLVRPHPPRGAVIVDSMLHIPLDGTFTPEQICAVKDSLIFENPAYKNAVRFSKYSYTTIPSTLQYFASNSGFLHVPLGTDLTPLNSPRISDNRICCEISQSYDFALKLRETQKEAARGFLSKNSKEPHGIVQMPTGKGKTVTALYIAFFLRQRTLIIVHKDDLVEGWTADIEKCFNIPRKDIGLIKAKSNKIGDFLTVATVQTLSRKSDKEIQDLAKNFGFLVCDEGHHCPSSSYDLINKFPARYKMCLTATPERKDGLTHVMKLYFGDFAYRYDASKSREDKDILPVEVYRREMPLSMEPLCEFHNGKWFLKDLRSDPKKYECKKGEKFMSDIDYDFRPKFPYAEFTDLVFYRTYKNICEDIVREYTIGHSCIVFVHQKEQVEVLTDYLKSCAKINENHVLTYYGNNNAKMNKNTLDEVSKNRQRVTVCTYSKATEGTNVKQWEVAFLVGTLNDGKNTEQAVGRIRRTMPEGEKLKVARVYDYCYPNVYSIRNHWTTRMRRYMNLGFTIHEGPLDVTKMEYTDKPKRERFTRGYSR